MATGACGVNCDVCRLRLLGTCSSCGPGNSSMAEKKLAAQKKLFSGGCCEILACAVDRGVGYCTKDCDAFPCGIFRIGPYPYSEGFLAMQERRRGQQAPALSPNRTLVETPPELWDALQGKDPRALCSAGLALSHGGGLIFRSFEEDVLLDVEKRRLARRDAEGQWMDLNDPLLELLSLIYFAEAESVADAPAGREIVGVKDLREAHYFHGPHALDLEPLLDRFGSDARGFRRAAEHLGGKPVDMADAAYRLLPLPRTPLYFLLWEGDEEFRPKISVLFERSIEEFFSASAIWMLAGMTSKALLKGTGLKPEMVH